MSSKGWPGPHLLLRAAEDVPHQRPRWCHHQRSLYHPCHRTSGYKYCIGSVCVCVCVCVEGEGGSYWCVCLYQVKQPLKGQIVKWLVPGETAAVSAHVLSTPYSHAPGYSAILFEATYVGCMFVTCRMHFWQNDRDLLRATAVTRGCNKYRHVNKHGKNLKKGSLAGNRTCHFSITGLSALPLSYPELSSLPVKCNFFYIKTERKKYPHAHAHIKTRK